MNPNNVKITREVVTKTYLELFVNGESKGKREINGGPSIKDFSNTVAKEFGIRSYTVTIDDEPVSASQANDPIPANASVAVNAKDARGTDVTVDEGAGDDEPADEPETGDEEETEDAA